MRIGLICCFFFFQAEDGIRDTSVTGVQTCALPISLAKITSSDSDRIHLAYKVDSLAQIFNRERSFNRFRALDAAYRRRIWCDRRFESRRCSRRHWLGADVAPNQNFRGFFNEGIVVLSIKRSRSGRACSVDRRCRRSNLGSGRLKFNAFAAGSSHQLFIGGDKITVIVQVANDEFGRSANFRTHTHCSELPHQVIGQIAWLGEKILKRRTIGAFKVLWTAESRIEVVLEVSAEIDLIERIFFLTSLLSRRKRWLFRSFRALAISFAACNLID